MLNGQDRASFQQEKGKGKKKREEREKKTKLEVEVSLTVTRSDQVTVLTWWRCVVLLLC